MTKKEMLDHIERFCSDKEEYAMILWCSEDAFEEAKSQGTPITRKEAKRVIQYVDKYHDCEIGVNWENIDCWIDEVLSERENNAKQTL